MDNSILDNNGLGVHDTPSYSVVSVMHLIESLRQAGGLQDSVTVYASLPSLYTQARVLITEEK